MALDDSLLNSPPPDRHLTNPDGSSHNNKSNLPESSEDPAEVKQEIESPFELPEGRCLIVFICFIVWFTFIGILYYLYIFLLKIIIVETAACINSTHKMSFQPFHMNANSIQCLSLLSARIIHNFINNNYNVITIFLLENTMRLLPFTEGTVFVQPESVDTSPKVVSLETSRSKKIFKGGNQQCSSSRVVIFMMTNCFWYR